MQVEKVEGNRALKDKKWITVDPKKRATSARLRRLIYYALASKQPTEMSSIREYIESQMGEDEYYSQGQLAGCIKNMQNNQELESLDRGIYQAGPLFDKRAVSYMERKPKITMGNLSTSIDPLTITFSNIPIQLPQNISSREQSENSFKKKRTEILSDLERSLENARNKVNEIKVSELSDEDFNFIRQFRQLDIMVNEFCLKYKGNPTDRCEPD